MKPATLLRLYPRAWRARYGDEFLALVSETRLDWGITMDVAKSALTEWLDHPNLRGGRELIRLVSGFVVGVTGLLVVIAAVQAVFMVRLHLNDVEATVLRTSRDIAGLVTWIWAISMALSTGVAWVVIRLRLPESRPRLASHLVKYLVLVAIAVPMAMTSPPLARMSPYSLAMLMELMLNVYCAGIAVHWAVLEPRLRRRAIA